MTFFANVGYQFSIPDTATPNGGIIHASAMPMHQLLRRKLHKIPFLSSRLFDPQLYLATLEATGSPRPCTYLATYPWFGCAGIQSYNSSEVTQKAWRLDAMQEIESIWCSGIPSTDIDISNAISECIEFQIKIGCTGIILPSPLTVDPSAQYITELKWLDIGLECVTKNPDAENMPIYATVAISDICLRYLDVRDNGFVEMIADAISARGLRGVYFVLEQGGEPAEARQCGSGRVLESILHLIHIFAVNCKMNVAVNFLGVFGLVCKGAGADIWSCQWYKSQYRFRLQDSIGGGRAFPLYWNRFVASDIHLENDFDRLNEAGVLRDVMDVTEASQDLNSIIGTKQKVENLPAWRYAPSNVTATREHFLASMCKMEREIGQARNIKEQQKKILEWLVNADINAKRFGAVLRGKSPASKTRLEHVSAWRSAFQAYLRTHNA